MTVVSQASCLTSSEGSSFLISSWEWAYLLETKAELSLNKLAWKPSNVQKLVLENKTFWVFPYSELVSLPDPVMEVGRRRRWHRSHYKIRDNGRPSPPALTECIKEEARIGKQVRYMWDACSLPDLFPEEGEHHISRVESWNQRGTLGGEVQGGPRQHGQLQLSERGRTTWLDGESLSYLVGDALSSYVTWRKSSHAPEWRGSLLN